MMNVVPITSNRRTQRAKLEAKVKFFKTLSVLSVILNVILLIKVLVS